MPISRSGSLARPVQFCKETKGNQSQSDNNRSPKDVIHASDARCYQPPGLPGLSNLVRRVHRRPLLAGLDKFTHVLTDWDRYLAPVVAGMLPVSGHTFMLFVGLVEIAAAVLVAARPRIGAYVVAAWLLGIVVNLLLIPGYFDIALRDFGLALGALALARLSEEFAGGPVRA